MWMILIGGGCGIFGGFGIDIVMSFVWSGVWESNPLKSSLQSDASSLQPTPRDLIWSASNGRSILGFL